MTKNQNFKPGRTVLVIEYCNLGFICNLVLVISNLITGVPYETFKVSPPARAS